jgi:hypothetical protein
MRHSIKLTAVVTAVAMVFALSGVARAQDRHHRGGMSTTEKVFAGVALAAAVGLTAYAISKSHRGHYHSRFHGPRQYVAMDVGFRPYAHGGRYGHSRGYWHRHGRHSFYRVPFRPNPRFDRAFNAGWERGYWAGFLQGRNDSRMGYRYFDRFDWRDRRLWGYNRGFGPHRSYEVAFHKAFRIGYRHGFRGHGYGHNGFGIGFGYYR